MLEIVWRNPNRLVRARVSVDKAWRNNPVTGQAQPVYRTRAAMGSPEVEYELVGRNRSVLRSDCISNKVTLYSR